LANCPLDELIKTLNTLYPKDWDGSHPNLKHYIPLLNRIDSIFENHIKKYKLDEDYILPLDVPHDEVEIITTCLNYSNQLLEYSTSRDIYNSHGYVADLMLSNSIDIKISVLNLICCLSEKFASHFPMKFSLSKKHKDLIIEFIKVFPLHSIRTTPGPTPIDVKNYDPNYSVGKLPTIPQDQNTDSPSSNKKQKKLKSKDSTKDFIHISLHDCMRSEFNVPSSWKILNYEYYKTSSVIKKKNRTKYDSKKVNIKEDQSGEGLRTFKLNSESLKKLSMQQIFDKAANVIPKEKWSDFVLHVYIAIAYSSKSFECLALRGKLVTFKCSSIAAAALNITYSTFVGLVFDEEPYLLSYMCDLINPDNHVPREPCIATLRAFVNISNRKNGASDLMRALGGNVGHGLLFHILKTILKQTKEGTFNNDQIYMNYIYNILANLLENKTLAMHLRAAGLMKIFLELLSLRNNFRMTRSGPLHLIEIFIERLDDAFDEFVSNDGFNVIISLLEYEVQFAIDNPDYDGGAPKDSNLSHKISARQVKLLNFLLKLVISLISTYPGDRMRNLYDSPMLKSIIKILEHPKLFGYELLYDSVRIMTTIINSEPTAYSILNESGIIDTFFSNFDTLLLPDNDLLLELPDAINAISLNNGGLSKVKEFKIITKLFSIFKNVEICKQLVIVENVMSFGHGIDELARHHPELKDIINEEILNLINKIPNEVEFNAVAFYHSSNGALYHGRDEKNIHNEPNSDYLERWDTSDTACVIQCTLIFLASLFENSKEWKRLFGQIDMNNLFKFITLQNAPFDYSLSKTIIHFRNIIKWIDQTTRSYCLPFLKERLIHTLEELHDFIHYGNDSESFFSQYDNFDENSKIIAQKVISNLGIMNCLLFVMSDFYSKLHKYQPNKILDIAEAFGSEIGLQLIEDLCLFYRRLALEEVLLHANTPQNVAQNAFTLVQSISPKQKEIGIPPAEECDWNGNSAKFKNISILYFNFSRSKFWLRNIFNSFCSINFGRRSENKTLFGAATRHAVGIITKYTDTMLAQVFNINTDNQQIRCGYLFCILNQLYLNQFNSFGVSAPVNPTMSICLLQNKHFPLLKRLVLEMFILLGTFDSEKLEAAEQNSYVSIDLESLVLAVLNQVLNIHAEIGAVNILGSIPNSDKLFAYMGNQSTEYANEVLLSIRVQAAIANYILLHELLFSDGMDVLNKFPGILPDSLIKVIISLSDVAFTNFKSHHLKFKGRLYPIKAETTTPSDYNVKFLVDLGVSEDEAKEILVFFNDSVGTLLSESPEVLNENFELENIDWENILASKYSAPVIEPIHLDYSPKYDIDTIDDLYFNISTREQVFLSHWVTIAQQYPSSISNVSNLLIAVFGKSPADSMKDVLKLFTDMVASMNFSTANEKTNTYISNTLTLIGHVFSDLSYSTSFNAIGEIALMLVSHLTEDSVEKPWFASLLMIFTNIFSETKIPYSPSAPKLIASAKFPSYITSPPSISCLDPQIEETLLELIFNIDRFDSEKQLVEVANLLVLLCTDDETIGRLAKSRVLHALVLYVKTNACSNQVYSSVINIVRRSVESDEIIKNYFEKEISQILSKKPSAKKAKIKDLSIFLEENSALVLRNANLFVEVIGESCLIKQMSRHFKSPMISKMTDEDKTILENHGVSVDQKKFYPSTNTSDIMSFLLSELMVISRKDMMMNITNENKEKKRENDTMKNGATDMIKNNRSLAYAVFLLQTIAELLFSYTSCKTEFLTFSKKLKNNSDKKPRSTALNMLVHKFITVNPFEKEATEVHNVHELLTSLGYACILGLVSTVPADGAQYIDTKVSDDVSFARKFTVDILIKILNDTELSKKNSIIRYGRIVDILNLIRKLCGESIGTVVGICADGDVIKHDRYYLAKELLDKKFSSIASGILARLDMNFPYTEQVSESILKLFTLLGEIKVQYQDAFKADQQTTDADEEVYDEDLEDRDDAPDLLRNSTLGMYDIDDVEDEDDFDDDFDDEFLVDDGIEIILSDNDGQGSEVEIIDDLHGDMVEEIDGDEEGHEDEDDSMMDDELDENSENDDDDISLSDLSHEMRGSQIDFVYESDDENDDMIDDHEIEDYVSNDEAEPTDTEDFLSDAESRSEESDIDEEDDDGVIELDIDGMDEDDVDSGSESDDSVILQEWLEEFENEGRESNSRSRRGSSVRDHGDVQTFPARLLFPQMGSNIPLPMESVTADSRTSFLEFTQSLLDRRNNAQISNLLDFRSVFEPLMFPKRGQSQFIMIKSTLQRWQEISELYTKKNSVTRVIPAIINLVFERSEIVANEHKRIKEEKEKSKKEKREEAKKKQREWEQEQLRELERGEQQEQSNNDVPSNEPIEPIFVEIGGRNVDISRTGIDPEFLLALPDDMREEVYEQHLNQSRFEERGRDAIDFIRNLSLGSSRFNVNFSNDDEGIFEVDHDEDDDDNNSSNDRDDDEGSDDDNDEDDDAADDDDGNDSEGGEITLPFGIASNDGSVEMQRTAHSFTSLNNGGATNHGTKKSSKVFFTALVDKPSVASLLKLLFVPQVYYKRELFFKTTAFLCLSKHTRFELIALILYILQEGIKDQDTLANVYTQICNRANKESIADGASHDRNIVSPANCTIISLATQCIDVIQYLLENEGSMRFHFLTDQENLSFIKKSSKKNKLKDNNNYNFPINVLLNLLENRIIKEDTNLMDILSRSIQIATRPLPTMKIKLSEIDKKKEAEQFKKLPQLPNVPDRSLKQIINILIADDCANKVFQQTIISIQNLSVLENARIVFPKELSKKATHLSFKIVKELRELINDLKKPKKDIEDLSSLGQFSSGASDQAKLLRILTALDYLYQSKDIEAEDIEELKSLYKNSALGPLWGALSDCLKLLREDDNMNYIAFILSPLIEALMVVCKHSKVQRMNVLDVLKYKEDRQLDFAKEPIESLFFTFTEEHKKILNHMIRNNPKLMSGPFSVLIRNPKVLEFDNKRVYFEQKLHDENNNETREKLPIKIRRSQVFLDSYRSIFFKPSDKIKKSTLEIHFNGEEGVDAGGVTREWYQVLSRQIFDPNYALFIPVASDKTTFHPNRTSWVNPEHLSFFKFVGMIIGKAVFDGYVLDCHFSRAVFKRILNKTVSLKDMESLDLDYYKSLVWMLENDITDIIVETFSVETDDYGEHKIIDLIPNGRDIMVTEENKQEYVKSIVEYRLLTSIKEQMDNFLEGFYSMIPKELISIFDEQELELLVSGLPDIDVDDWKNNTIYENYSASSPQIQWFWRAIKSFDIEERAKLLQFATGTSKVPLNGFKELTGMNGISKFSVHRVYNSTDRLPTAHTCFNQIDLPEYESYTKLRNALLLAIREGHEGFGFA
jgi:E3 ubiquitin-protein ligase HUWE1